jgi:hypothetical protein
MIVSKKMSFLWGKYSSEPPFHRTSQSEVIRAANRAQDEFLLRFDFVDDGVPFKQDFADLGVPFDPLDMV